VQWVIEPGTAERLTLPPLSKFIRTTARPFGPSSAPFMKLLFLTNMIK
jgi:hypothetical protein